MKKNLFILALVTLLTTGLAFADGMVFDPTEFEINTETTPTKAVTKPDMGSNAKIESNIKEASSYSQNSVSGQSTSFNNALFELDSAQVNIRNELLDYKAKYQEVDTQYQLIKEQRRVLAEQIKSVEKRIKDIEKSKSQIRKTMI
ncbi:hypothetical protein IJ182_07485 [bacterium]|nr:hypothetical protein [bacterium]